MRWVEIGPTVLADGTERAGYRKLSIVPVPGPKKKPAPRKKKTVEEPAS